MVGFANRSSDFTVVCGVWCVFCPLSLKPTKGSTDTANYMESHFSLRGRFDIHYAINDRYCFDMNVNISICMGFIY